MSTYRGILNLCLVALLIVPNSLYAGPKKDAKASFQNLIQDPFINATYQAAQGRMLRTFADKRMAEFFDSNPIFQAPSVVKKVNQSLLAGMNSAVNDGRTGMSRVTMETSPRVRAAFESAARNLGYTEEQIANARIYRAEGEMNAYTVSPFQDQIVVVIYGSLIDVLDDEGLRAVIGHELNHILSKHVLRGVQHTAMIMQLAALYAKDSDLGNTDMLKLRNYEQYRETMKPHVQEFWDHVFSNYTMMDDKFSPAKSAGDSNHEQIKLATRTAFLDALELYMKAFESRRDGEQDSDLTDFLGAVQGKMDKSPETAAGTVAGYLEAVLEAQSTMTVPTSHMQYLADLLNDLPNADQKQRSEVQFAKNMMLIMANGAGKALEDSADGGAETQTDAEHGVMPFAIFTNSETNPEKTAKRGAKPTNDLRQQRWAIIKEKIEDWMDLVASNPGEKLLEVLGGDVKQNHSVPLKRIINILTAERTSAIIGLRKPTLKHVIIYNQLLKQEADAAAQIAELQAALKSEDGKKLKDGQRKAIEEDIKALTAAQEESAEAAQQMTAIISDLIEGAGGFKGKNLRLMDILDYQLALREDELEAQIEALKKASNAKERAEIRAEFKSALLPRENGLTKLLQTKIQEAIKAGGPDVALLKKRAQDLGVLTAQNVTLAQLDFVRRQLQTDENVIGRKTRTALQGEDPITLPKDIKAKAEQEAQAVKAKAEKAVQERAIVCRRDAALMGLNKLK